MPFSVGEAINNLSDKLMTNGAVQTIVGNPFYSAFLISLILLLIILFIFRGTIEDDEDNPLWKLAIKSSIYMFIISTGVFFLYSKNLEIQKSEITRKSTFGGLFQDHRIGGGLEDAIVPVQIGSPEI